MIIRIFLILVFSSTQIFFPAIASLTYEKTIEKNVAIDSVDEWTDLTFNDLVKLSKQANPEPRLASKLESHFSMVYIVNNNNNAKLTNDHLRFAHWNIKRGLNIEEIKKVFLDTNKYEKEHVNYLPKRHRENFKIELHTFAKSDVISLNEVDIGMPRTNYKNIAQEFADTLGWNYVYASEFIELGPLFLNKKVDKNKYRGLHGNAIISRYPIISAKVIRLPNYYDWYGSEAEKHRSPIECLRYAFAKSVFAEEIQYKEVRHGSRSALIADLKLPDGKIITIVSTHLEDRAYADQRLKQFKYVLNKIKDIKNPIVLCGDFNTIATDNKPTSLKKEWVKRIRDPHFILRTTGSAFIPGLPFIYGVSAITVSKLLQYKDPFFPSIPIVFPNHERRFYSTLKKFRFSDGVGFDLSGDTKRSSNGKKGLLANSNQRHWKGFKSTFRFEKPRLVAYFKLDWFFIKPDKNHFLPCNARTLKSFNNSYPHGLSDHNPITVDLKL